MSILEKVENMSAEEMQAADQDDLIRQIIACNVGDVAQRYLQARTDAKIRDVKLAEQAETLTALKKGIEAITQQAVDADWAGDKIIKDLEQQKSAMNETIGKLQAQMTIDARSHEDELVAAREEVARLADVIVRHVNTIRKLTTQANTYAKVIGVASAMFLEAMTAKAVADTAADAS